MSKPELLILDDEEEVLSALNRVLRHDFQIFLFSDPHKALDFFEENPVPLVVSDMRMPVMDGTTFLARISELNSKSKKFILTGHADINETETAATGEMVFRHFEKPWDNGELISELKVAHKLYLAEMGF